MLDSAGRVALKAIVIAQVDVGLREFRIHLQRLVQLDARLLQIAALEVRLAPFIAQVRRIRTEPRRQRIVFR
jgi:hypothetical protein